VRLLQSPHALSARTARLSTSLQRSPRDSSCSRNKRPFVEFSQRRAIQLCQPPSRRGKADEEGLHLVPIHHELDSESIATLVASRIRRFEELPESRSVWPDRPGGNLPPLPLSGSLLLLGVPAHSSLATVPAGATVGGGTGCHVLAVFMRRGNVEHHRSPRWGRGGAVDWRSPFTSLITIQNMGDGRTPTRAAWLSGQQSPRAKSLQVLLYTITCDDRRAPAIGMVGVPALAQELSPKASARDRHGEDLDRYIGAAMRQASTCGNAPGYSRPKSPASHPRSQQCSSTTRSARRRNGASASAVNSRTRRCGCSSTRSV